MAPVVRLQHTTRDQLNAAWNMLEDLEAPVLGTVLTGGKRSVGGYYQTEGRWSSGARFRAGSRNGGARARSSERTPI